jgi:hypothetical protein
MELQQQTLFVAEALFISENQVDLTHSADDAGDSSGR